MEPTAPVSREKSRPPEPRRRGGGCTTLIALAALVISMAALVIASWDQPWFQRLTERYRTNLGVLTESVSRRARAPEPAEDPAETLREASRAAQLGEEEQARSQLSSAAAGLLERAQGLSGNVRRQWRTLAREASELSATVESGARGARAIRALTASVEDLIESDEASPESEESEPNP